MQSTVNQEQRIKNLWEENMKLASENVKLAKQVEELEQLNTSYLKATIIQTDKVNALEDGMNDLNAQIRLLVAIIREGGDLDEIEQATTESHAETTTATGDTN